MYFLQLLLLPILTGARGQEWPPVHSYSFVGDMTDGHISVAITTIVVEFRKTRAPPVFDGARFRPGGHKK